MSIQLIPYKAEHEKKVQEFNQRLRAGGEEGFIFPETSHSFEYPSGAGNPVELSYFVAQESTDSEIHGGYILKSYPVWKLDKEITIGNYQLPLSEGIVNPKYGMVGIQVYLSALKNQTSLYALGMGSLDRPLPVFLKKMKWQVAGIPFYFKILKPGKVIRYLPALRSHKKLKSFLFVLDQLKFFSICIHFFNLVNKFKIPSVEKIDHIVESNFGKWADEVWLNSRSHYKWVGKRDAQILNLFYPENSKRFIRLHIKKGSKTIGWALVLATQMNEHRQFPNLKVGTVADTLAIPGEELAVVMASEKFLHEQKVDLIITNQSHFIWCEAFKKLGFISGPTNFIAAFSPDMWKGLTSFSDCHVNRGDGDGPINL